MHTILSGVLVAEVSKELLDEIPLPVILPVILYDADELLLIELSFLEHETTVRLKRDIKIMCKIFFIFYFNTKSKILLVRRTQNITSIGLFYKYVGFYLEGAWL